MSSREPSRGVVCGGPLAIRRQLTCAECHKVFKSRAELVWHAEACLMEAFENEVYTVNSDCFRPKIRLPTMKQATPAGITVKVIDEHPRQEHIQLKMREDEASSSLAGISQNIFENEEDISSSQTIQGPGGLQLMISVEKNTCRETLDEPPVLDAQVSSDDMHLYDEIVDEEDDNIQSTSAYTPTIQVLGALANPADDLSKPKIECPTCGIILYRHNFAAHYRIHTGELPFACTFCPKRFRTSSSLKVHVRAHTGEKPYACESCEYATITKRNLDRHFTIHHQRSPKTKGPMSRKSRYRGSIHSSVLLDDGEWAEVEELEENYKIEDHHYNHTGVSGNVIMTSAAPGTINSEHEYLS